MEKICLVLSKAPGYSETFFRSKIKGLQKNGFQVTLFCQTIDSGFDLCPVKLMPKVYSNPVLQIFSFCGVFLSLTPFFKRVLKFYHLEKNENTSVVQILKKIYLNAHFLKTDADWVHFGFATMALGREFIPRSIGAKSAVSFRGFDIGVYPLKHPNCYKRLWKTVDKVHTISMYLLEQAYALGLKKETPYELIPPAVDLKKFSTFEETDFSSKGKLKLVTIARLHWIKGINSLIETAEILQNKNIDFEWTVIGSGKMDEEERYRYYIYEAYLKDKVILKGKLSHEQTLKELENCQIYVQTSLKEGFCNAVLEAQTIGRLTLAFAVGGIPENILDKKTGWVVPKFHPEQLAAKIIEVSALNSEKKQKISQQAQERVKNSFSLSQQKEAFTKFYNIN